MTFHYLITIHLEIAFTENVTSCDVQNIHCEVSTTRISIKPTAMRFTNGTIFHNFVRKSEIHRRAAYTIVTMTLSSQHRACKCALADGTSVDVQVLIAAKRNTSRQTEVRSQCLRLADWHLSDVQSIHFEVSITENVKQSDCDALYKLSNLPNYANWNYVGMLMFCNISVPQSKK